MAEFSAKAIVDFRVNIVITEEEARALIALSNYADADVIRALTCSLSDSFGVHASGISSLLKSVRTDLLNIVRNVAKARSLLEEEDK